MKRIVVAALAASCLASPALAAHLKQLSNPIRLAPRRSPPAKPWVNFQVLKRILALYTSPYPAFNG